MKKERERERMNESKSKVMLIYSIDCIYFVCIRNKIKVNLVGCYFSNN